MYGICVKYVDQNIDSYELTNLYVEFMYISSCQYTDTE